MAAPTNVGLRGHRYLVIGKNSSASQIHRVQRANVDLQSALDVAYELGNVSAVGADQDPYVPTFTMDKAMVGLQMEYLTSNKTSGSVVTLGDIVAYANNLEMRLLKAHNGPVIPTTASLWSSASVEYINEEVVIGGGVSQIRYAFGVRQMLTESWTIVGREHWIEKEPTDRWGAFDTTSPGLIRGKNAVVFLGGAVAANTGYRVQAFTIDVNFSSIPVDELGNRALVGYNMGEPAVNVSFDVLESDIQPDDIFTAASGTKQVYRTLVDTPLYVMVFDPGATRPAFGSAETATALKGFTLDNVVFNVRGLSSQVRGLATKRYQGQVNVAAAAGTGGLKIFNTTPV